jgi:low affinity Fe/Cu permease
MHREKPRTKIAAGRQATVGGHFESFAAAVARLAGRPLAFLAALGVVLAWALTGPFVGFSDTWQLIVNTGTTVITFLMVFLIQHTQNRDTLALQIKVAELVVALKGADSTLAAAEDLSEESLEQLHRRYEAAANGALRSRRGRGRHDPHPP